MRTSSSIRAAFLAAAFSLAPLLGACTTAYHGAMREFTNSPAELLELRVAEARDSQREAARDFKLAARAARDASAQTPFHLERTHEAIEARAWDVRKRIASIRDVSPAFFGETPAPDAPPPDHTLHRLYDDLMQSMDATERSMLAAVSAFELLLPEPSSASISPPPQSKPRSHFNALASDLDRSIEASTEFLRALRRDAADTSNDDARQASADR